MKLSMRFAGMIVVAGGSLGMAASPALALNPQPLPPIVQSGLVSPQPLPVIGQNGFLNPQPLPPIVD
jgi:hypothetical protein